MAFTQIQEEGPLIDETDGMILKLLSEDARRQYADLGKAVHLSAPAVHARVKKLEQMGIIRGYTIKVDPETLGKPVCAFIRIVESGTPCDDLAAELKVFPEIEECHSVAGEDCVLAKARTSTPYELEMLLKKIRQISGVQKTVTTVALRSHFERGTDPAIS